jgi:four helix bundle protein
VLFKKSFLGTLEHSKPYFMIKTVFDLEVFKLSYQLAMEIFNTSRHFPKEERYSLTDQVVRSSRSISANIAEGWGKRIYENEFKRHLIYGMGSLEETKVWLHFAKDCLYLSDESFKSLDEKYDQLGARIYKLFENWKTF